MRVGVVGTGLVAGLFLEAAATVEGLEVTALCCRPASLPKAQALAATWSVPGVHTGYKAFLSDPRVDVVYVGLPNHLHHAFAAEALEAGRHVIVEKPFTAGLAEAEDLANLATRRGLFLFEAICTLHHPLYAEIRRSLPTLGPLRLAQATYAQYSSRYGRFLAGETPPVFDPAQAGGALMDLGVYNVHFFLGLLGRPDSLTYRATMQRGIDTSGVLVLAYPGFLAVSLAGKDCAGEAGFRFLGEAGALRSDSSPNDLASFCHEERGGRRTDHDDRGGHNRLYHELVAFQEILAKSDFQARDRGLVHSLSVIAVLDEARRQVGIIP